MLPERFIIGPLALLVGILFCFAGYRLFRVIMAIWGFLLGLFVSIQVITSFLGNGSPALILGWGTGILLGLVLALLAYALYAAAITLLGASFGYILGVGLMTVLGVGNQTTVVVIAGLILAGLFAILILALDLARLLIVVSTALGGATTMAIGILLLYALIPADFSSFDQLSTFIKDSPAWLLLWLGLVVAGSAFQIHNTRRYQLEKYVLARRVSREQP